MRPRHRVRQACNALNLTTFAGLLIARAASATVRSAGDGLLIATSARMPGPRVPAYTVGNVILARQEGLPAELLEHEARHASQWAWCLGPGFLPLYWAGCAWSWVRCGDWWSRNAFEQRAGLAAGGYVASPTRAERRQARAVEAGSVPVASGRAR